MASRALEDWEGPRREQLEELLAAHRAVGGPRPGRRYTTTQLNHALALAVAAQFQGFCRDLHSEAATALTAATRPPAVATQLSVLLTSNRKLDRGNAHPGALGEDFVRFGMDLWSTLGARDKRTSGRRVHLDALNTWRNAIAHQDFRPVAPRQSLMLPEVKDMWSATRGLAVTMDREVGSFIAGILGAPPW